MSTITKPRRRCAPSCRKPKTNDPRRLDRKRRRRIAHKKAQAARRALRRVCQAVPEPARSLFDSLAGAFTRPSWQSPSRWWRDRPVAG